MASSEVHPLFGDRTEQVKEIIVNTVLREHSQHAAAQQQMDPRGRRGYGASIWDVLPKRVGEALQEAFLDATLWTAPRAKHPLPVMGECIIWLWRVPGGNSPENSDFFTSPTRLQFVEIPVTPQQTLFSAPPSEPEGHELSDSDMAVIDNAVQDSLKPIMVAVESIPDRLHQIRWGEVTQGEGRKVKWLTEEFIYTAEADTRSVLQTPKHGFTEGQPPTPFVKSRKQANE